MNPPSREASIEHFESVCRQRGLPLTAQRRHVFMVLLGREDHPTAEQIFTAARSALPDIAHTTVYRILETFVELGLINKICHPGSAARFDPKTHQHHHLVCQHCGGIVDLEDARLNRIPLPDVSAHDFEIRDYHIHYRGLCADCRREANGGKRSATPPTPTEEKRQERR